MKLKLMAISILLASPAFAQQPEFYNLRVTPAQTDIISKGLQTQPFGEVYPLINNLREQIIAQQPKPVVTDPPKPAIVDDPAK